MLIGEVARRSGVPTRTIRFYETQGVVSRPTRAASGYRTYADRVLEELRFVKQSQRLGFSLADISELVTINRAGKRPCDRVAALCDRHLEEIDARIAELQRYRDELTATQARARAECSITPEGFCSAVMTLEDSPA
jgi:MerR family copper efflux transcriptional regulator